MPRPPARCAIAPLHNVLRLPAAAAPAASVPRPRRAQRRHFVRAKLSDSQSLRESMHETMLKDATPRASQQAPPEAKEEANDKDEDVIEMHVDPEVLHRLDPSYHPRRAVYRRSDNNVAGLHDTTIGKMLLVVGAFWAVCCIVYCFNDEEEQKIVRRTGIMEDIKREEKRLKAQEKKAREQQGCAVCPSEDGDDSIELEVEDDGFANHWKGQVQEQGNDKLQGAVASWKATGGGVSSWEGERRILSGGHQLSFTWEGINLFSPGKDTGKTTATDYVQVNPSGGPATAGIKTPGI